MCGRANVIVGKHVVLDPLLFCGCRWHRNERIEGSRTTGFAPSFGLWAISFEVVFAVATPTLHNFTIPSFGIGFLVKGESSMSFARGVASVSLALALKVGKDIVL